MSEFPERFNLARWLLEPALSTRAGAIAVRSTVRDLSYAQVSDEAARVQTVLRELGHQPEQRVLLVCPDVPEFVTCWGSGLPSRPNR